MKKAALLLAAGLLFCGASAVSCDTPDKGYIAADVTDMGVFDYDAALSNMTICGSSVDLSGGKYNFGDSFEVKNGTENEMDEGSNFDFCCGGKTIGTIRLNCKPTDTPNGKKILSLELNEGTKFEMNGISNASTFDDLTKRFGEPVSTDRFFIAYSGKKGGTVRFYRVGTNGRNIQSVEIIF